MRIDAHMHLWDLAHDGYGWNTPDLGALHRTFTAEEAERVLEDHGLHGAVLVQAADTDADTDTMLDVADSHSWVRAVVGWIDLEAPGRAADSLDRLQEHPHFRGVRQLIHDDPRHDVLGRGPVRQTLAEVARRGLTLDVPDAFPRHLRAATAVADALPELVVVLDHLAKPPRGSDDMARWEREVRDAAVRDNTVAKLSGLGVAGQPFNPSALRPVWDVVLEAFGPRRLMFGTDWPVSLPHGGAGAAVDLTTELVADLSDDEQQWIWYRTAQRIYRFNQADEK